MTEIAIRDEQSAVAVYQEENIARLARWAEQADAAVRIADVVVGTAMCPKAYRNKPQEGAAAILAGAEMGLSPMASLRAFDDIQGTPAPKAITLRAVVQARGHDLEVVEAGTTRAVVEGRRKGSDRWQRIEWTIERAEQAGYVANNPKWRTDPTAQLVARATAEMARWLDSAAIMGLPYSAEEIGDATGVQAQAVTRRVTAADFVVAAAEHAPAATSERPVVDALTADEAIARIRTAETQDDLDTIRVACQAAGLRDHSVKDAWAERAAQLVEAAP